MRGPGKGKSNNPAGKPKGTPNKTTKEARELFIAIMNGQIEYITDALEKVRTESPSRYLDAISKLFQYTMPKQIDIKSDGDKIGAIEVTIVNGEKVKDTGE